MNNTDQKPAEIPQNVLEEILAAGKVPVKVIIGRPPCWAEVCKMIGGMPQKCVFAWGDTIYNPDNVPLPDYIIDHENVHFDQQKAVGGPDAWWSRYLEDPYFRVAQEVEAYAVQYVSMCRYQKDRNARHRIMLQLAGSLSGPLYGNIVSRAKAVDLIRAKLPK